MTHHDSFRVRTRIPTLLTNLDHQKPAPRHLFGWSMPKSSAVGWCWAWSKKHCVKHAKWEGVRVESRISKKIKKDWNMIYCMTFAKYIYYIPSKNALVLNYHPEINQGLQKLEMFICFAFTNHFFPFLQSNPFAQSIWGLIWICFNWSLNNTQIFLVI